MNATVHGVDQEGKSPTPLVGALLRRPFMAVRTQVVSALRAAGFADLQAAHLTVFQYPGPEGRSPSDLARTASVSKQAMNNLLAQLERAGYLSREVNPENRRERTIRLTARGGRVIAVIRDAIEGIEAEWRSEVGDQEYECLRSLLQRLNAVVEG